MCPHGSPCSQESRHGARGCPQVTVGEEGQRVRSSLTGLVSGARLLGHQPCILLLSGQHWSARQ